MNRISWFKFINFWDDFSVEMHDVPPDAINLDNLVEDYNDNERVHPAEEDKRIEPANEFYDGEKDQDGDTEMQDAT